MIPLEEISILLDPEEEEKTSDWPTNMFGHLREIYLIPASHKAALSDPNVRRCHVKELYQQLFEEWISQGCPNPSQNPRLDLDTYQSFLETQQKEAATRSTTIQVFDRFPKLPTEVKMNIVEFCHLSPRILRVADQLTPANRSYELQSVPATAHVNQQLRDMFLKYWKRIEIVAESYESKELERMWLYFNYRIDTLVIDSSVIIEPPWATHIRSLVHMARINQRRVPDVNDAWINQKVREPLERLPDKFFATFPSLKTYWLAEHGYYDTFYLTHWRRPSDNLGDRQYTKLTCSVDWKAIWKTTWPAFRYYVRSGKVETTALDFEEICDIWKESVLEFQSYGFWGRPPFLRHADFISFVYGEDKPKDDGKVWQSLHCVEENTDSLEAIRRRLAWGMVVETMCANHKLA